MGIIAHLVETLQEAHDAALDLFLAQSATSAVHADGDKALDLGENSSARSGSGDEGTPGGGPGGDARDRGGGAEDGGAKHGDSGGAGRGSRESCNWKRGEIRATAEEVNW